MNKEKEVFKTEDKAQRTVDGFDNFLTRVGLNNDNALSSSLYTFNLLTKNRIQLEAAYRGSWVVGQVIDLVAEDMTKAGIDIQTTEGDNDISKIQANIVKLGLWGAFSSLIKWSRLYGGSIAVIQIKGQDPSTPFDVNTVGKGQFLGLVVYDRWQLNPVLSDVIKEGPEMGLPKYYQIVNNPTESEPSKKTTTGQIKVHHSRVIRSIGIELPYFQAITEMMWGESILERLWDRLISFDNTTMSAANLVERANNRTVHIENLREIIAAGGKAQQGLEAQFEMMRQFQTNEGLTLLDKNDEFSSTAYSFAGLDGILLQFGQQLGGATGIPLVRLFGQSPAGLSSTGDSDLRTYYDNINSQQKAKMTNGWDMLLKILWMSVIGKPQPDDLTFDFVPLWQMSTLDKATVSKTTTETILGAFESGLIKRATALTELRESSGDTGIFTNITDEEINEAENDAEDPPLAEGIEDPEKPEEPVKNLDSVEDAQPSWIKRWLSK